MVSTVSAYPLSPFQDRVALFPVTCKISKAAFEELKKVSNFRLYVGMALGTNREIKLFYVDNSLLQRLSCYHFPVFSLTNRDLIIEPVAPALCRGFDEECNTLLLRAPKWFNFNNERTILCDKETEVESLQNIEASFCYSGKERLFTSLPSKKRGDRDTLELHIDFKDNEWDLSSQFQ